MNFLGISFVVLSILALGHGNTLEGTIDVKKLQSVLEEGAKSKDITTLYYSIKGLKLLNAKIPDVCEVIKNYKYDLNNLEQIFYLTNAAALLGCVNYLKPEVMQTPTRALDKTDTTVAELYHAVYSLKALGKGTTMNKDEALKNLIQLLKKDDSPANYGYVFTLCEHIGCTAWTVTHAEAVLAAADETDGKALHFEGGLPVTSMLLSSIIRSYKTEKKAVPLSESQRVEFAQYLAWRGRGLTSPRHAAILLDAALALADDQPTPISITIKGRKYITAETDSIEISVSDLLGRPVRDLKPDEVVAQSGTRLADDVVVLSKQPLVQKPTDPTIYILNLSKIKSQYGLYKIALSAGTKTTTVNVSVLGEIQVSTVEIGIGDVDGTTSPKITTVAYPNKLTEKLQADHLQKVSLKFTVRDQYKKPVLVQQAFARVAGADDTNEAIFVAEPDNTKAYKVELNVGAIGKHLKQASGQYSVSLYLGDRAAAVPVAWPLGLIQLHFGPETGLATPESAAPAPAESWARRTGPRPELAHTFRAAEARPPRLVSDVFAALCAAPLLLLLALWARLRLNLAAMPAALAALLFHLSLGASLSLYAVLWLKLTMFETMRYLLPLGLVTFLSGHRLLRRLAHDKSR